MQLTVDIYHNVAVDAAGVHLGFMGYEAAHSLLRVFRYETEVTMRGPSAVCEEAFWLFNVGDDPEFSTPDRRTPDRRATYYRFRGNRSLSIGDVVSFRGLFFACASHGFTQLKARPLILDLYGSTPDTCHSIERCNDTSSNVTQQCRNGEPHEPHDWSSPVVAKWCDGVKESS